MKKNAIIQQAALIILTVLLSLFIAEWVLRLVYPDQTRYYVWQPDLQHTFHPDSTIFCGIRGDTRFTINTQGLRGEQFRQSGYNRLLLGGSTTECLYLDDHETWWYLWDSLTDNLTHTTATASIGKSGITTREHYLQVKYVVPQLKWVNELVLMVGFNDLMKRLSADTLFHADFRFTPAVEDSLVRTIFLQNSRSREPAWWRRTVLFQLAQRACHRWRSQGVEWMIQDDNGESLKRWRQYRQQAVVIKDTLPDLTAALAEYRNNLELIYHEAKKQQLQLIFINQAALYKDTMTTDEQRLLWMGGMGEFQKAPGHAYYSAKALRKGVERYNAVLQNFCVAHQLRYIDIDAILPRDTSVFYDDCHFNEHGARLLAEYLSSQGYR